MFDMKKEKDHLSLKLRIPKPPRWAWHLFCDVFAIVIATLIIDAIQESWEEPPLPVIKEKIVYKEGKEPCPECECDSKATTKVGRVGDSIFKWLAK